MGGGRFPKRRVGGATLTRRWSLDVQDKASMVVWVEPKSEGGKASLELMGKVKMGRWV